MTQKELSAQAANIQRAVGSTATCSSTTAESLRLLLLPAPSTREHRKPLGGVPASTAKASSGRAAKATIARARKQTAVTVLDVPNEIKETIKPEEKLALATGVVNTTLKALTDAIKHSQVPKVARPKKTPLARSSSSASFSSGSPSRSQTPLQPISVNRLISSPDTPGKNGIGKRRLSTESILQTSGLRAQGECARIGFACLRILQAQKISKVKLPFLQLETGMSALVAKLLALGFDDLAVKELRILKRRLENSQTSTHEMACLETNQSNNTREDEMVDQKKETLAGLLQYQKAGGRGPLLALMITSQLQVLRILAMKANCRSTEAAIGHLQLEDPHSPANLIMQQIDPEIPASKANAVRQLESLAQSLTLLCPDSSSSCDELAKSQASLSPQAAFQLQVLAFEIRSKWWTLSNHQVDGCRDMIEPITRCVSAFHRRCKMGKEEKYAIARHAYENIARFLRRADGSSEQHFSLVYQILADMAQESSHYSEAIEWIEKAWKCAIDLGATQSQQCALRCRMATLQIHASHADSKDGTLIRTIRDAAESLGGGLQGGSAELDDLLVAVSSLRKSAFSILQESYKNGSSSEMQYSPALVEQCTRFLLLCPQFLVRYIGKHAGQDSSEKQVSRCNQRKKLASQVAKPMIESVVGFARLSSKIDAASWERLDAALRDCIKLASSLDFAEDIHVQSSNKSVRPSSPFISISNAYWCRYMHLQQAVPNSPALKGCLQTSIDLLKHRPRDEQVSGSYLLKLEKYASLCESLRDYTTAVAAYEEALRAIIDCNVVRDAAESAAKTALSVVLDNEGEFGKFARTLLAYPRAALRVRDAGNNHKFFYDAGWLSARERGLLLEHQLVSMVSSLESQNVQSSIYDALHTIMSSLLSLYTKEDFPIRRMHILNQMLHLHSTHPASVELTTLGNLLLEQTQQSLVETGCFDVHLRQYASHLIDCRRMFVALRQATPELQIIEEVLASWSKMLQECHDWHSIQGRVYNISEWLVQLNFVADFLAMQGIDGLRLSALHLLVTIHESATSTHCSSLILKLSDLGLHHARLGYSGPGGVILQKAQRYLEVSSVPWQVKFRWYLSYAEYALISGNIGSCQEALGKFRRRLKDEDNMKDRYETTQLTANADYVQSMLAAARGREGEALLQARMCVKGYYKAWAILERRLSNTPPPKVKEQVEIGENRLAESMSELSLSEPQAPSSDRYTYDVLRGAAFWNLVPRLSQALLYLSRQFEHNGLLPEALYYLEQSQKIIDAVRSPSLTNQILSIRGQYTICSGDVDRGMAMLQKAEEESSRLPRDYNYASLQILITTQYIKQGQLKAGSATSTIAASTLQRLTTKASLESLVFKQRSTAGLELQMTTLSLRESGSRSNPQAKARPLSKKATSTVTAKTKISPVDPLEDLLPADVIPLNQMRGELLRQNALASIAGNSLAAATSYLGEAAAQPCDQQQTVTQALANGRLCLRRGLQKLDGDPVFGVIPESTIACPSIKHRSNKRSTSQSPAKVTRSSRNPPRKGAAKRIAQGTATTGEDYAHSLQMAQKGISDVFKLAASSSSTAAVHQITDILGRVLMMLSALPLAQTNLISAVFTVYVMELGRTVAMMRESQAIDVERRLSDKKDTEQGLRQGDPSGEDRFLPQTLFEFATFQAEYIDIIPVTWTAISMTLSESREEILISKLRAAQRPFVLRLPLKRQNAVDCDNETFGFDHGKSELRDIISLANLSTHSAEDLSRKGAKKAWWDSRATLDARLKDLLINMESIWLGGFRGIFSQDTPDADLLARFQQSLQNILDKHLPSRQKSGKGSQESPIVLDRQVVELFVGLGAPSESNDIDEQLMDLLYFVVDILQFNGERNAYDEIDFDSLVIESLDALRHYHHAIEDSGQINPKNHTILILDKHLHCFPWESLPCMSGNSVSRLPSLVSLRTRILLQEQSHEEKEKTRLVNGKRYADSDNGTYILNPAGDLINTQSKFEEPLQELSNWKGIVQREPNEAEMKSCLENHSIFLYFGHGSGGQYIRSRTIKKLDKCAVALLMGCSSGALTEAGEFEPYGTPMNYMHAGCPAVLATLWDVTDKDIDRFSQTVLESWGLFKEAQLPLSSSPVKQAQKGKGKYKAREVEKIAGVQKGHFSLDEAVSQGRDSCILKYLNGAAPVLYGVPIYLS